MPVKPIIIDNAGGKHPKKADHTIMIVIFWRAIRNPVREVIKQKEESQR
jgi:hypothetical protein